MAWLGVVLILGGLSLLGYVGWQMYGTNWVSQRQHAEVLDALQETWDHGADAVETEAGPASAVLRIPRFGEDWAMPILPGDSDEVLSSGVAHLPDTAGPGEAGNYVLAAHRVTHGEPFRDLPELQPGDEVIVETRSHVYTYVLDTGGDDLSVPFTAAWVLASAPANPDGGVSPAPGFTELLTLTTCAELFHTDDRLVAFGHLVGAEPRG